MSGTLLKAAIWVVPAWASWKMRENIAENSRIVIKSIKLE